MDAYKVLILLQIIQRCSPGTWVNMTIVYDFVATNEIIILQNYIQEYSNISDMRVGEYNMTSTDVPPSPLIFNATAISYDSVYTYWSPVNVTIDGNLTVQGYTVFYRLALDPKSKWSWTSCWSNTTSLVVERLAPITTYTFRVLAFHSMGNGISSNPVDVQTFEGTPTIPINLTCKSDSPSSVNLFWVRVKEWRGRPTNYTASFRFFAQNISFNYSTFNDNAESGRITGLDGFTSYELFLTANTNAGSGTQAWCTFKTLEGVPSIGPETLYWYLDRVRPFEAVIQWSEIPKNKLNGRLLKYKISYWLSRNGSKIIPPALEYSWVDNYTTGFVMKNLLVNAEYTVFVSGETIMGSGNMSKTIFVESCKCPDKIYAAYYPEATFVTGNTSIAWGGIFYEFLKNMTNSICPYCPGLKNGNFSYNLYWDRTKDGKSPSRNNQEELKQQVYHNVHFHLPISGKASVETFQSDYKYVQIVSSPGIAFIVIDKSKTFDKSEAVAAAIFSCWPAVVIIFLFSSISGMFMWVLDCHINKIEFPNESFIRGMLHGIYWAYVSMTTIGYGDKTPRSFPAKVAAIIWMLTGPITNAIVIGAISTTLTSVKIGTDPILYGTNVGAITNSCEYTLGVRRNAQMTAFGNASLLLEALEKKHVDGVLLDSISVSSVVSTFSEKKFKIVKIIPVQCGWGIVLSAEMINVEKEIRSYVKAQAQIVKSLFDNATNSIAVSSSPVSALDTGLIDPKSPISQGIYKYGSIFILCAIIVGFAVEVIYARLKKEKLQPYSAKEVFEVTLSKFVRKFCNYLRLDIESQIEKDETEIKAYFIQKGYSLGLGWVPYLTVHEEDLKKQLKYQEIMCLDLGEPKSELNILTKLRGSQNNKEYKIFK